MSTNRRQIGAATKSQAVAPLLATARKLHVVGRRAEADAAYRDVLDVDPKCITAMIGLAALKYDDGDLEEASRILRKALRTDPRSADAHHMLGVVLARGDRHEEAIDQFRQTLRQEPENGACEMRLGNSLVAIARYSEAARCFERIAAARPANGTALNNLGLAQLNLNLFQEAAETLRRAVRLNPAHRRWQSNYLMCLNYLPDMSPERLFEEHQEAGRAFSCAPDEAARNLAVEDPTGRRLRVGFVSPDFKSHSVAYFFEPLLAGFDREAVESFLYAEVAKPDETTVRLHDMADHWYSTVGRTDEEVTERIRADRVDVLFDLAGHTRGNRLGVFARRAAPVQVTWLGYGYTTGLAEMDFRITDAFCDPPGAADSLVTETLVRLPDGFLCYRADPDAPAAVDPPCLSRDFVTFGSFNNPSKINETVVALWVRVLERVPGSRILLKNRSLSDPAMRERLEGWFVSRGIESSRVELLGWSRSTLEHFEAYGELDIALDSFPYNGTTTSCEALWMGVPVVTKIGDRNVARTAANLLGRIGMEELAAADENRYVEIACALAGNRNRLRDLRHGLRGRMRASTLMDGTAFARHMEAALRQMLHSRSAERVAL